MRRIMTHAGRGLIMALITNRRRCIRAAGPMALAALEASGLIFRDVLIFRGGQMGRMGLGQISKGAQTDQDRIFRGARIVRMARDLISMADRIVRTDLISMAGRTVRMAPGLISMADRIVRTDRIFGQTAGTGKVVGIAAAAAMGHGILTAASQAMVGITAGTAISEASEKLL